MADDFHRSRRAGRARLVAMAVLLLGGPTMAGAADDKTPRDEAEPKESEAEKKE